MTASVAAIVLSAVILAGLAFVFWNRLRGRHRQELSDRDASYKALLEINVRHYRDIAERDARYKNLLEQAREGVVAEAEGRIVFENNPQPMWVFDEETMAFLAVNEALCRHYGYSREEFLGMTIEDIRPSEDVPVLFESLATESREFYRAGVWRHRTRDGTTI